MNQPNAAGKPFKRLLLTGAAGNLGRQLRGALAQWADVVRLSDIAPLDDAASHGVDRRGGGAATAAAVS